MSNQIKGRRVAILVTSWPTLQDDIRNAAGSWQGREVVRDRNWVSSRKPDDLPAFNRESIALVSDLQAAKAMRLENRNDRDVRSAPGS